jgi:hypothetical protein
MYSNSHGTDNAVVGAAGVTGGTSALTLLGVAFVVLKLTGYITWSWLWVLSPFWGPFILICAIFALGLLLLSLYRLWISFKRWIK